MMFDKRCQFGKEGSKMNKVVITGIDLRDKKKIGKGTSI